MNSRRVRDIDYTLMAGTDRATTDIVIERNGVVVVRPPNSYSEEQVDAVVESKRMWIYRNLAEWRDLNAAKVVREWVNGETFLYLGRAYRLSLVSGQASALLLKEGRFQLDRALIDQAGNQGAKKAFEQFYTEKGQARIAARASYFAEKVGVKPAGVKIKDLNYRWANCTSKNMLNFHWKSMMAPPKVIDYMIVHELCHIHERNHTVAFWNEVDKVMPDYRERKDWLRTYGASLDI